MSSVVFHSCNHALLLRIPPLVGGDAVAIAVGSRQQGGMAGSGPRVGVVIVALAEGRSPVKEQSEAALAELLAVTFEVVTAKLVDDDDDDQPGTAIVGRRENSLCRQKAQHQADNGDRAANSRKRPHC